MNPGDTRKSPGLPCGRGSAMSPRDRRLGSRKSPGPLDCPAGVQDSPSLDFPGRSGERSGKVMMTWRARWEIHVSGAGRRSSSGRRSAQRLHIGPLADGRAGLEPARHRVQPPLWHSLAPSGGPRVGGTPALHFIALSAIVIFG